MIITKLSGGLGNQIFQYAVGRALSLNNKTELKLDISEYSNQSQYRIAREYRLHFYNVQESFASLEEIRRLKYKGKPEYRVKINKLFSSLIPHLHFKSSSFIREKAFAYEPDILKLPDNVYLEGYWQSEKYFKSIEPTIRQEFTLKPSIKIPIEHLEQFIDKTESVSIHVRRGDYVSDPVTNAYHGVCSQDYYQRAIDLIGADIKNPHFFIFSDEPEWVKTNMKFSYPTTYMTENGTEKDYIDLYLMSKCKHHIIANSSFSWWGAWLCENKEKTVIAPRSWFNNPSIDTKDLIPESWQKI